MKYSLLIFILFSFCSVNQEQQKSFDYNSSPESQDRKTSILAKEDFEADNYTPKHIEWYLNEQNELVQQLMIDPLVEKQLDETDIEIRIWSVGGIVMPSGFILNRKNGNWQGVRILPEVVSNQIKYKKETFTNPKSSWEIVWNNLLDEEILTLPNAESIDCNAIVVDGSTYVFEIKKGEKYRTYSYSSPQSTNKEKCPKNINIINIFEILHEEFPRTE